MPARDSDSLRIAVAVHGQVLIISCSRTGSACTRTLSGPRRAGFVQTPTPGCWLCVETTCYVWITTVRSEPALGDATALISNARSFPSRRTAVGQIEGRMVDPAGWVLVTMAVTV